MRTAKQVCKSCIRWVGAAAVIVLASGCAGYVDTGVAGPAYPVYPEPSADVYVTGPDVYVYGEHPRYGPHREYWHRGVAPRNEHVGGYRGVERGAGSHRWRHEHEGR
jgi:hypothetical protein